MVTGDADGIVGIYRIFILGERSLSSAKTEAQGQNSFQDHGFILSVPGGGE
jgi:hypothetical protein